jgi:hypothetical protein
MNSEQTRSDQRANEGVLWWGVIFVVVVALLAIVYNLVEHKRATGSLVGEPTQSMPRTTNPPATMSGTPSSPSPSTSPAK